MKTAPPAPLTMNLDVEALRPLVERVVESVLARMNGVAVKAEDRLAYTEAEAAGLLGMNGWQLRDERLRGRIAASAIVGRRVRHTRADLEGYLARNRTEANPAA